MTDATKITYYVTKYALTEGIIVVKPGQGRMDPTGDYLYFGGGNTSLGIQARRIDFFASLDDARARVKTLVEKKLKNLDRQVRKLQQYQPKLKSLP